MLMHTTAGGAGNVLYHDGCDGVTPGNTCDPVLILGQDHAIRAIIVTGEYLSSYFKYLSYIITFQVFRIIYNHIVVRIAAAILTPI